MRPEQISDRFAAMYQNKCRKEKRLQAMNHDPKIDYRKIEIACVINLLDKFFRARLELMEKKK